MTKQTTIVVTGALRVNTWFYGEIKTKLSQTYHQILLNKYFDDNLVFYVPLKLFKSYQDDGRMIMKGSVQ